MANLPRPPLITKIEPKSRHAAIDSSPQQSRLNNLLVGKDTFFRGPGQSPVYDWPNPVGHDLRSRAYPSVSLKTWTENTLRFIGKDQFFGAPGETKTYDWPNPVAYDIRSRATPNIVLKTWTANTTRFIGLDSFFRGPGIGPNYDYPNPSGHDLRSKAQPIISLKTWIDSNLPLLVGQDRVYGEPGQVPDYDWPNPRGPRYPQNVRMPANVVLYAPAVIPTGMQLYPVQGVRRVNQNVLNWLPANMVLYAVGGMPMAQYVWSNPRGPRQPMLPMLMVSENRLVLGATTDAFFEGFQRIEWGMKPQTAAGMGGVLFE